MMVCIDSLMAPSRALDLRASVEAEHGRPPDALVLSHFHGDHILGLETLGARTVISHHSTRSTLVDIGEAERRRIADGAPALAEDILSAEVVLPTVVMGDTLTLHIADEEVQLMHVGPAHTISDVVAYLPTSRALVTGDVSVWEYLPVMLDADSLGWVDALRRLEELEVEWVVPGHGPVTGASSLAELRRLLMSLREQVADHLTSTSDVEELSRLVRLPPPFSEWGRQERLAPAVARIAGELTRGGVEQ